jgi:hypothetical protein
MNLTIKTQYCGGGRGGCDMQALVKVREKGEVLIGIGL